VEQKILEKLDEIGRESADRRGFLKKAGQVAATVPAVALLLSAQTTPAEAHGRYGRKGRKGRKPPKRAKGPKGHKGPKAPKSHGSFVRGFKNSGGSTSALRRRSRGA
jgi:hypothetical protein